jgi:hypothetical protein
VAPSSFLFFYYFFFIFSIFVHPFTTSLFNPLGPIPPITLPVQLKSEGKGLIFFNTGPSTNILDIPQHVSWWKSKPRNVENRPDSEDVTVKTQPLKRPFDGEMP